MNDHTILEWVGEVEDPAARVAEAERLFKMFDDSIPKGYFIPHSDFWYPVEKVEEWLLRDREFYDKMDGLLGNPLPEFYVELRRRFEGCSAKMLEVTRMDQKDRQDLLPHQMPPFIYDFDRGVKSYARDHRGCFSRFVRNSSYFPELLGQGGFGAIYAGESPDGEPIAVKIFHVPWRDVPYHARNQVRATSYVKKNLYFKKKVFRGRPFVRLLDVFPGDSPPVCLMERFDGKNVEDELNGVVHDKELVGRLLTTYLQMLEVLHSQSMIFLDNNWGNVLFNNDEVVVCDYDFVSSLDDISQVGNQARNVRRPGFTSKGQLMQEGFSFVDDLEGLALMVDRLYLGDTFLKFGSSRLHFDNVEVARANKRVYPKERSDRLPLGLQDVVTSLLTYPRDESLTIDDFRWAVSVACGT